MPKKHLEVFSEIIRCHKERIAGMFSQLKNSYLEKLSTLFRALQCAQRYPLNKNVGQSAKTTNRVLIKIWEQLTSLPILEIEGAILFPQVRYQPSTKNIQLK